MSITLKVLLAVLFVALVVFYAVVIRRKVREEVDRIDRTLRREPTSYVKPCDLTSEKIEETWANAPEDVRRAARARAEKLLREHQDGWRERVKPR